MKINRPQTLFTITILAAALILSSVSAAIASGSYRGDVIVWSKSECSNGSWHIWRMNDDGSGQTQMTTGGFTDEHPVLAATETVFVRDDKIYKMPTATGQSGGLTLLADTTPAHHPYVFGSKVYYVSRPGPVREIWRMNLSDGGAKELVLPAGGGSANFNMWHPTVATYSGKDYLTYVQGDPNVDNDSLIRIYNLTDSTGPVTLLDGAALPAGREYNAPSILPDGTGLLYVYYQGLIDPSWPIRKRDFGTTPMTPGGDTTTDITTGSSDMTPYADDSATGEMTFMRIDGSDADIFHKVGLAGTGAVSNRSLDSANIDTFVVELSSCNPQPVPCPTGTDTTIPASAGFLAMMIGSVMLFRQRRKSRILV